MQNKLKIIRDYETELDFEDNEILCSICKELYNLDIYYAVRNYGGFVFCGYCGDYHCLRCFNLHHRCRWCNGIFVKTNTDCLCANCASKVKVCNDCGFMSSIDEMFYKTNDYYVCVYCV